MCEHYTVLAETLSYVEACGSEVIKVSKGQQYLSNFIPDLI
jgi:hypothetical protein